MVAERERERVVDLPAGEVGVDEGGGVGAAVGGGGQPPGLGGEQARPLVPQVALAAGRHWRSDAGDGDGEEDGAAWGGRVGVAASIVSPEKKERAFLFCSIDDMGNSHTRWRAGELAHPPLNYRGPVARLTFRYAPIRRLEHLTRNNSYWSTSFT